MPYKDAMHTLTGAISSTSHDKKWGDCFERTKNQLHLDSCLPLKTAVSVPLGVVDQLTQLFIYK